MGKPPHLFLFFFLMMNVSRDVALAMLRRGQNATQILEILNVLVPEQVEMTREYVCEQLGIADCPENNDEIEAYLQAV